MRTPLVLIATVLLATGCQTAAPVTTNAPDAEATSQAGQTGARTPDAALRNTRWVLRQLNSQPVPPPTNAEPYVVLRQDESNAEGNGSCNRFRGTFESAAAGQLRFGALLSTRMACASPDGNTTETGFMRALENTRTYRISGDTLRLFADGSATPAAVLHAVYLR
ncbi:META domain-containing protein [Hymenobacter canadensis]|uniref:META domain-containing protein n=1 Tax=Hymenobacter canadensis TaxID=2999067 RepID=A0ABY7LRM7_9BACT|nr:META domain-containing protein [Hymenobacter canadensis]WBA42582.1 META domain-containing protein [Hymenobacter canadensis]